MQPIPLERIDLPCSFESGIELLMTSGIAKNWL